MAKNDVELPESVRAILCCPSCRGEIGEHECGFRCGSCNQTFPRIDSLVRFVNAEHYAGSFGYQWHRHAQARWGRMSELTFQRKTGFSEQEIQGKLVLDVGCGTGRMADVANRLGAQVIAVDLSSAAEVAANNLKDEPGVTVFQADVFNLPFKPASFDHIYSIGVLHHTPNCEKAFKALPSLLKPGGKIAIWVYSGYQTWYRMSDWYRKITTHLPAPWLHALCEFADPPLYYSYHGLRNIPLIGRPTSGVLRALCPWPHDQDLRRLRVLSAFDWYSPKYQSKHTYEEVFRWFEDCGLQNMRVMYEPVSIQGSRAVVSASLNKVA